MAFPTTPGGRFRRAARTLTDYGITTVLTRSCCTSCARYYANLERPEGDTVKVLAWETDGTLNGSRGWHKTGTPDWTGYLQWDLTDTELDTVISVLRVNGFRVERPKDETMAIELSMAMA